MLFLLQPHSAAECRCRMGRGGESKGGGDCLECEELMGGSASVGSTMSGYPRASSPPAVLSLFLTPHAVLPHSFSAGSS